MACNPENSSKSSTNFQNLATPQTPRSVFCQFISRSSEQCGAATFSEVAGINVVNLHCNGDDEMPGAKSFADEPVLATDRRNQMVDRYVRSATRQRRHGRRAAAGGIRYVACDFSATPFDGHQSVTF
jgi:hypothetical protein